MTDFQIEQPEGRIWGNLSSWRGSQVALVVKNLPASARDKGHKGREDPLEDIYSSILAWRFAWTEEPGRLQSMWSQKVTHD